MENSGDPSSAYSEMEQLHSQVSELQKRSPCGVVPSLAPNIVIKNIPLPEVSTQQNDGDATLDLVKNLFTEGLEMENVDIVKVVRKGSKTNRPGIVTVSLTDDAVKRGILSKKLGLRDNPKYQNVFIEPELPRDVLQQQRNPKC